MKNLLLAGCLLWASQLFAARPIELKVWPNGAPLNNGLSYSKLEADVHAPSAISEAILYVYPAEHPNGQAILDCPGGGYAMLAMDHEGHNMADWMNAQGITYAVLKYRMPNGHKDVPLSDAQEAMRIMRRHAKEWCFEQLGVMGSSAGGHLASTLATHFTDDSRPDFQILFYPVITMNPTYTHMGSHDNLLGKNVDKQIEKEYSNELQIKPNTPPAFIMHSSDDDLVPVDNSINYYKALTAQKISASLHIYPVGGHGWGYRDSFPYKRQWTGELEQWLKALQMK